MWAALAMLCSATLHALWNTGLRRERDPAATGLVYFAIGCGLILCGAAVELAVRGLAGADVALRWALAAGASEACYLLALSRAMRIGPLAPVYGVSRGLPLLLLWPLSHALLREDVTLHAAIAVTLLLAGLVALLPSGARTTTTRAGYAWAAITAIFNTTNALIYKSALARGAPVLLVSGLGLLFAMPAVMLALQSRRRERTRAALRERPIRALLEGAALGGSFLIANLVMRHAGAAWVMTLRNASIGLAPLVAWAMLGERPSRRTLLGVALVLGGAVALMSA